MTKKVSWRAQVSICATALALSIAAIPAFANGSLINSFAPSSTARAPAQQQATIDPGDLQCMTEALYHEARGEGVKGQQAVAEVILNRVDSPRFPSSVCGVVNQRGQFSYKGRVSGRYAEQAAYHRARNIAASALAGAPRTLTGGATYFHTPAVRPSWSRQFTRTTRIGSHIFYRPGGQRLASN